MNLHAVAPTPTVDTPGARVRLYDDWGTDLEGETGTVVGPIVMFRDHMIEVQLDHQPKHVYAMYHELQLI